MSSWAEIDKALEILKKEKTTIMQCSSIYPCPEENVGLNIILEMQKRYRIPVGFSDHYLGCEAGFAAAALGVCVIEKHITFSRGCMGLMLHTLWNYQNLQTMLRASNQYGK